MQRKKSGLGKGLDALIPGSSRLTPAEGVVEVPLEQIERNPRQPRNQFNPEELTELADSIRQHGIIQPLIVSYQPVTDRYTLIAGERRLQAARLVGLAVAPVIIREATEQQFLEIALIENIQRADLNPLEAAEAYRQLADDFGLAHEDIAFQVGKSRTAVTNTLRLLKLPVGIQQYVLDGKISEGHARALLALPSPQAQVAVLKVILERDLNVRQTEELVRKYQGQKPVVSEPKSVLPEIKALEDRLRSHLGTKVRLNHGRRGGSITIHYYSAEELDDLIQKILPE